MNTFQSNSLTGCFIASAPLRLLNVNKLKPLDRLTNRLGVGSDIA